MKQVEVCSRCGGELKFIEIDQKYKCSYCGALFEEEKVEDIKEQLNLILDQLKQEKLANLRTLLYEATHEKYQSSNKIINIARSIREYVPDDFLATFYELVNVNPGEVNNFLNNINIEDNYYAIDLVLDYMINVMNHENILAVNNLIEKAYKKNDLKLYDKYTTLLQDVASKLDSGIYELNIPRDVFIAYSSKDIKYVEELCSAFDKEEISYFVSLKNLRHGKGAVENYLEAIETAMDNCRIFLFISSNNSRSLGCDALKKEIPYLKKKDIENAPSEYRYDYSKIPSKYKKPRIQYILTEPGNGPADKIVKEIFEGYEWRYSASECVDSVVKILLSNPEEFDSDKSNSDYSYSYSYNNGQANSNNNDNNSNSNYSYSYSYNNDKKTNKKHADFVFVDEEDDKKRENKNEQKENMDSEQKDDEKDPLITFLLCFFFGIFGAHFFYLGKKKLGVLCLLTLGFFIYGNLLMIIYYAINLAKNFDINKYKKKFKIDK